MLLATYPLYLRALHGLVRSAVPLFEAAHAEAVRLRTTDDPPIATT